MKEPKVEIHRDPNSIRSTIPMISVNHGFAHSHQAVFAKSCIEKWALIAAAEDGEDSAGRSKLRPLTPEEIVQHACTCADLAYREFERRGWLIEMPSFEEAERVLQERENARGNGS